MKSKMSFKEKGNVNYKDNVMKEKNNKKCIISKN